MNTSLPRMFSLKRTETSPSSNRVTATSPSGTRSLSQIACASFMLAFPAKMRTGSKREPPWLARASRGRGSPNDQRRSEDRRREPGSVRPPHRLAGAGGLEPPDARYKVSCLTAWPRPTNERGFRDGPSRGLGPRVGVLATGQRRTARRKAGGMYWGGWVESTPASGRTGYPIGSKSDGGTRQSPAFHVFVGWGWQRGHCGSPPGNRRPRPIDELAAWLPRSGARGP